MLDTDVQEERAGANYPFLWCGLRGGGLLGTVGRESGAATTKISHVGETNYTN